MSTDRPPSPTGAVDPTPDDDERDASDGIADANVIGPHPRGPTDRWVTYLFKLVERVLLVGVVVMTLVAVVHLIASLFDTGLVELADILLMFLFVEVISMVTVYYSGRRATFIFPILIAITALSRLILLQGKDMAAENVVFEALAILLLAIATFTLRGRATGAPDGDG